MSSRVTYENNGEQTLVVVDGERVSGVIALDDDVEVDDAVDVIDSIELEIAHAVSGLRLSRESISKAWGSE